MAKYYAVRSGYKTGIYMTWDECKEQVNGFAGAEYKSFKSFNDAQEYMNEAPTVKKYYAVKVGKVPGIYTTWDECKLQVHKYPSAKYKTFPTYEAAEDYMKGEN